MMNCFTKQFRYLFESKTSVFFVVFLIEHIHEISFEFTWAKLMMFEKKISRMQKFKRNRNIFKCDKTLLQKPNSIFIFSEKISFRFAMQTFLILIFFCETICKINDLSQAIFLRNNEKDDFNFLWFLVISEKFFSFSLFNEDNFVLSHVFDGEHGVLIECTWCQFRNWTVQWLLIAQETLVWNFGQLKLSY